MGSSEFTRLKGRSTGRRLHGSLAVKLGREIVSGRYPPGCSLGGGGAFHQDLDVSRSAYREAIKVLSAKGLVESRPRAGTKVLPRNKWNLLDPDVLDWASSPGRSTAQFNREFEELRAIVEPQAARLAAQRITVAELDLLVACVDTIRDGSAEEAAAACLEFHHLLLLATRNEALICVGAGALFPIRQQAHPPSPDCENKSLAAYYMAILKELSNRCSDNAARAMATLVEATSSSTTGRTVADPLTSYKSRSI